MNKISLGLILISCLLPLSLNEARGKPSAAALTAVQQDSTVVSVFKRIEKGILEVDVKIFFDFLSSETYLSLKNGISGYYSANQSYYILQDYLSLNIPAEFKFTGMSSDSAIPYASGILKYSHKGVRGDAQIFISLKTVNGSWQISQITIN